MTQSEMILGYMQRGRSIDPQVALRMFACMRLAPRIWDLKRAGHRINREMVRTRDDKVYARYSLAV